LAISGFVLFHLTATVVWNIPDSPLRRSMLPAFRPYMLPLGLWQSWWMFAPDPMSVTAVLDAEVIDARGMRHIHEFPRVAGLAWWQKLPRFRHPKFTCNLLSEEFTLQREFTARHAVRQLKIKPEHFPVRVSLYLEIKEPPPTGQDHADPLTPTRLQSLGSFDFASIDGVQP
jgi:hypothetical protein